MLQKAWCCIRGSENDYKEAQAPSVPLPSAPLEGSPLDDRVAHALLILADLLREKPQLGFVIDLLQGHDMQKLLHSATAQQGLTNSLAILAATEDKEMC